MAYKGNKAYLKHILHFYKHSCNFFLENWEVGTKPILLNVNLESEDNFLRLQGSPISVTRAKAEDNYTLFHESTHDYKVIVGQHY